MKKYLLASIAAIAIAAPAAANNSTSNVNQSGNANGATVNINNNGDISSGLIRELFSYGSASNTSRLAIFLILSGSSVICLLISCCQRNLFFR